MDDVRIINQVERAVADLRRGCPVILRTKDDCFMMCAAETMPLSTMRCYADRCETLSDMMLVLTENRTLHVLPEKKCNGMGEVAFVLPAAFSEEDVLLYSGLRGEEIGVALHDADIVKDAAMPLEAAIKLVKVAELMPAVLLIRVRDTDVKKQDMLLVDAVSVSAYEHALLETLKEVCCTPLTLKYAKEARIHLFRPASGGKEHYAIVIGNPKPEDEPYVRIHSSCYTGDLLNSLCCDCHDQLHEALDFIGKKGSGIVLYLMQEGRGIGLSNKLRAYDLQRKGVDTVDANTVLGFDDDERPFMLAAVMLKTLGITSVRLLTNNPRKVSQMEECGIRVKERVAHEVGHNEHNALYLETKAQRLGHMMGGNNNG